MVDALGNPLRIHITAGNVNDIVPACDLIEGLLAEKLLADRAYDANKLLALYTKSAILLNVFLPGLNHFAELLLDMISWP